MKNKLLLFFLLFASFLIYHSQSYGQVLQVTSPNITFAACPGEWINYTVNNQANPIPTCYYTWTVTNGEIEGGFQNGATSTISGSNMLTIKIRWFEVNKTQTGKVTIKAESCDNANGNDQISPTIPILSLKGVDPSAITGDNQVNVNVTANKVYEIDPIDYPNVGSSDLNPKEVSGYEWQLPNGWTVVSGGNTKRITVKPDNCTGGTIRVRGKNTACTNGPYYSNWSPVITIARTLPNPGAITGPPSVNCTDVSTKTYSITAVTGATSYTWTKPSGWGGTSTTNSITVTPSGSTAGNITVVANGCTLQSQQSSLTIQLNQFDPANPPSISGITDAVCSSTTYTLVNQPPQTTYSWSSSNAQYFPINSSTGEATRLNGFNGVVTISANISGICGSYSIPKQVIVGTGIADPLWNYINVLCVSTPYIYDVMAKVTPAPGVVTYKWYIDGVLKKTTSYSESPVPGGTVDNKFHYLRVDIINSCGMVSTATQEGVFKATCGWSGGGSGGNFTISPNPTSDELKIEYVDNVDLEATELNNPIEITLFDKFQNKIFSLATKGKLTTIPISNLPNDIYYLIIISKEGIIHRRIQVNK